MSLCPTGFLLVAGFAFAGFGSGLVVCFGIGLALAGFRAGGGGCLRAGLLAGRGLCVGTGLGVRSLTLAGFNGVDVRGDTGFWVAAGFMVGLLTGRTMAVAWGGEVPMGLDEVTGEGCVVGASVGEATGARVTIGV